MPDRYLARNPRAAWRVYEGEAVILSADDSTFHRLNAAGTAVWIAADGATPWQAIVGQVARVFAVPPARVEADVAPFVEAMEARGLLTTAAAPAVADGDPLCTLDAVAGPWAPARVSSETVFETTALACGKLPAGGGKCNAFRKVS
jgi:hypothetical protein